MLNNFGGSFFDVGAARCTDGIWLSLCQTKDKLYVLLDFEGIGSFEKTSEQDMLSSLFGAGISNILIIRTSLHFDRFTKSTLGLWASGARHLIGTKSANLFNGKLILNPRDVNSSDIISLLHEFRKKFCETLNDFEESIKKKDEINNNKKAKVLEMFKEWVVKPMNPNNSREYYDDLFRFKEELNETLFKTGMQFLSLAKLYLAQLSTKDFSSLDDLYIRTIISDVNQNLDDAIFGGSISSHEFIRFPDIKELFIWVESSQPLKEKFRASEVLKDNGELQIISRVSKEDLEFLKNYKKENLKIEIDEDLQSVSIHLNDFKDSGNILGIVKGAKKLIKSKEDENKYFNCLFAIQKERFNTLVLKENSQNYKLWIVLFQGFLDAIVKKE